MDDDESQFSKWVSAIVGHLRSSRGKQQSGFMCTERASVGLHHTGLPGVRQPLHAQMPMIHGTQAGHRASP